MTCKSCGIAEPNLRLEPRTFKDGTEHVAGYCSDCDAFVMWVPQELEPRLHFGKYNGQTLRDVFAGDPDYVRFILESKHLTGRTRDLALNLTRGN